MLTSLSVIMVTKHEDEEYTTSLIMMEPL
jgi:hypothetical protein